MENFEIAPIFVGLIVLSLLIRLIAGSFDGDRVKAYVEDDLGGELIDQSWDPLGPGWFGEKDSRIYEIVYRDKAGSMHRASVKTSMLSGVYFTRDQIIESAKNKEISLEEEELALRQRLSQLEEMKRKES